jgi:hypothetical protein
MEMDEHRHSPAREDMGKSVASNRSKIHMIVNSCGLSAGFDITGGQAHDSKAAPEPKKQTA